MAEVKDTQGSRPIKFTLTHYRKPEHTHEAFIDWIVNWHLPRAIPIFKKHGILEYKIFTTPSDMNSGLKAMMIEKRPTWSFADFDCFLEYTVPNIEALNNVMSDPDWPAALEQEPDWVDASRSLLSIGYETPYLLSNGDVVNVPGISK
ncbi:unnamed protein product [Clonostachys solani]|uniref:EthD domain-containing protein n=1 Tax=Clonostachys solani TaxID=160281 RepID=A0A9N9WB03_9HYPO|nr:unnamed protein product [Clonostachys solani]